MNKLYVTENWSFAPATLTLKYSANGSEEMIDPKTATLLRFLMDNHKQVSAREEIYNELYGIENARADGTITAYVSKLRKLLEGKTNCKGKYIRTIPKAGYQFIGPFQIMEVEPETATESVKLLSLPNGLQNTHSQHANSRGIEQLFSIRKLFVASIFLILITLYASIRFSSSHSTDSANKGHEWSLINEDMTKTNNVALSLDGLNLAFIQASKSGYSLIIKDTFSTNQTVVFKSKTEQIAAPAFSPSGTKIAFLRRSNNSCLIQTVDLVSKGLEKPKFSNALDCGIWHADLKLGYLNERELIYTHRSSMTNQSVIFALDLETQKSTIVSSSEFKGIEDYSFAINSNTQQIAILRSIKSDDSSEEKTSVYIYNVNESLASHVLTIDATLLSLEWLTNEKLIALNGSELTLIDIAQKDIRPTNLVKMKEELNPSL